MEGITTRKAFSFAGQARGSLAELIDDLNICIDEAYLSVEVVNDLKVKAYDINKRLNGYIAYLRKMKAET